MSKILHGDALEVLQRATENSVDAIVTDPPYGLSFMNKHWDYDVPSVELWIEVMRVLKPGGHLLSFAGSRTYHRMAVNIEDAGFDIRDQIMWVYGSGFPKSHNIGKAVDKKLGNEREETTGGAIASGLGGERMDGGKANPEYKHTKGTSEWEGWGTALKPAHEPIVVARKPFKGTVVDNVLEHGTGGINIDGCRVEGKPRKTGTVNEHAESGVHGVYGSDKRTTRQQEYDAKDVQGRFPANFIHDGSDEVVGEFPDTKSGNLHRKAGSSTQALGGEWVSKNRTEAFHTGDSGSAARFFYCAKASKAERNKGLEGFEEKVKPLMGEFKDNPGRKTPKSSPTARANHHPTVKPVALMQYLVRLVTPKNGTVLDPFMGSGSTGIACKNEGFNFIGIEREEEYVEIAEARICS